MMSSKTDVSRETMIIRLAQATILCGSLSNYLDYAQTQDLVRRVLG